MKRDEKRFSKSSVRNFPLWLRVWFESSALGTGPFSRRRPSGRSVREPASAQASFLSPTINNHGPRLLRRASVTGPLETRRSEFLSSPARRALSDDVLCFRNVKLLIPVAPNTGPDALKKWGRARQDRRSGRKRSLRFNH